jgi:hypothetical protein
MGVHIIQATYIPLTCKHNQLKRAGVGLVNKISLFVLSL